MKKITILFLLLSTRILAQTGIGTTTPNASAKLDVFSTNKGFLPPRVTLTAVSDISTISSPAEGLLVYNLGSVGLQAGYYYWNGANWATIATATLAGNAVAASDLVKLYQESYATTSGKVPSSDGFSFTVPASGRYEFNFNSTGWNSNGSTIKLTFNIRQGATVLGTDYHQSSSSNVWAEYEGRVEANLTAGVTYNAQVVKSTGNRDYRDWDKIMYKMVAGNLPYNQYTLGDVKTGMQSGDHNGWIKLNGRLKSTLSSTQQTQATALGIGTNLPDATNAFLVQNGSAIGSINGANTKTIAQANLPNVSLSGTTSSDPGHAHTFPFVTTLNASWGIGGGGAGFNVAGTTTTSSSGIHAHTLTTSSINGNVPQTTLDITPRSLSVNTFIYLGL
jgi:hypothetical protein